MHNNPNPPEILAVASDFIRNDLVPNLPPDLSFNARVLANALDLVARQIREDERVVADSYARLVALMGQDGPEDGLTAELARRIEAGDFALEDPALIEYLWTTTLAKLAVDQPKYASFRAETEKTDR